MKRWFVFICILAFFGTVSVGDPLFGLVPDVRSKMNGCYEYALQKCSEMRAECANFQKSRSAKEPIKHKKKFFWNRNKKKYKPRKLRRRINSVKKVKQLQDTPCCEHCSGSQKPLKHELQPVENETDTVQPQHTPKRRMRAQFKQPSLDLLENSYPQPPISAPSSYVPQPYVPPAPVQYVQPVMQQPIYQNNAQQMAASAMQLQASAMAMQAQASAMMMQAQQQAATPMIVSQQMMAAPQMYQQPEMLGKEISHLPKQEKVRQLMYLLEQLSASGQDIHRLLILLDTECDIIEKLLARSTGQAVESLVTERASILRHSSNVLQRAYNLVIDLSSLDDQNESDLERYNYYIRRSGRSKDSNAVHQKKKFLMQMLYKIEQYYQMIEKMQTIISPQ